VSDCKEEETWIIHVMLTGIMSTWVCLKENNELNSNHGNHMDADP
jgi:hypothetical protein